MLYEAVAFVSDEGFRECEGDMVAKRAAGEWRLNKWKGVQDSPRGI